MPPGRRGDIMYHNESEKKYTARSEYSKKCLCPYYVYNSTKYTVGGRANRSNFIACSLGCDGLSLRLCFESYDKMRERRAMSCEDIVGYTECPVFRMMNAELLKKSRRNNEEG